MTGATVLVLAISALIYGGSWIVIRSTAKPVEKREPGDREEDNEFGSGFGCALFVLGLILVVAGAAWSWHHIRVVP